ncbi:MAG: AAA family ATPase [Candidatus Lokiarchaeota archaeon]|nr:AAA family ATPase [Candidatus Lokiarchaeota archaeon]
MKILIVSGTPGTGKTTISNNIQNYIEAKVISLNELAISENLVEKYDVKRETSVIDKKKIISFIIDLIEDYKKENPEFLIIESHFSDIVPERYIDFVIILRCDPDELYNRLKRRGYKREKIRENVQSEILGNCVNYFMNKPINTPILEIETTVASIESITKTIVNILTKKIDIKDFYAGRVDWLEKLFQEDRLQMFFD